MCHLPKHSRKKSVWFCHETKRLPESPLSQDYVNKKRRNNVRRFTLQRYLGLSSLIQPRHDVGPPFHAQLLQQVAHVHPHRVLGDVQLGGDPFRGQAVAQAFQDVIAVDTSKGAPAVLIASGSSLPVIKLNSLAARYSTRPSDAVKTGRFVWLKKRMENVMIKYTR